MRIAALFLTLAIVAAGVALVVRWTGGATPDGGTPRLQIPLDSTPLFWGDDFSAWMHWDVDGDAGSTQSEVRVLAPGADSEQDAPRWTITGREMSSPSRADGLTTRRSFGAYLLHFDFKIPNESDDQDQTLGALAGVELSGKYKVNIADSQGQEPGPASSGAVGGTPPDSDAAAPAGEWQSMEIAFEEPEDEPAIVSVWLNGQRIQQDVRIDAPAGAGSPGPDRVGAFYSTDQDIPIGTDNATVLARFRAEGDGTIFSRAPAAGPWEPNAKAVFLRGGRLTYDIGWVGAINAGRGYDDGEWHTLAFVYRDRVLHLYVDGELRRTNDDFISEDDPEHVFKIGAASSDFAGNLQGSVSRLLTYDHALTEPEIQAFAGGEVPTGPSTLDWIGPENRSVEAVDFESAGKIGPVRLWSSPGLRFANVWIRPLPDVDHMELITQVSPEVIQRGQRLYEQVCMTCHGSPTIEGTLPTSRRFHDQPLEAGADPYSMYMTLDRGYNEMLPQVWMSAQQKYDVIHFLRESLLRGYNEDQYFEITPDYLASLPRGRSTLAGQEQGEGGPDDTYRRMDFGPSLNWTFEVTPDNIAYKGIAVRLDEGEGGISQGNSWVLYDHDTMRVAAMWQGGFVDWRGIAFDGSHQTHTKIAGDPVFANPVGPGWARPGTSDFDDPRLRGRDDKLYGPLPRDWVHYKGLHKHGNNVVVSYTVGSTDIHELPALVGDGVLARTFDISDPAETLRLRVAPADVSVAVSADPALSIEQVDGFNVLVIPADSGARSFQVFAADLSPDQLAAALQEAPPTLADIRPLLAGGAKRWPDILGVRGELDVAREWEGAITENAPYAVDSLFVPRDNPWNAWMRLGGFDFYPDGDRAVVCTWNGDVWLVSGIDDSLELITWQRIATGLFQALGLKIVDDTIYVACRDQIVRLHDLNDDNEIDYFENFNNDHQVTEHFHEFAMGLDTDADGNFYYAKGARHAKTALVPQHGTLLKVARDGSTTEIIANGFRAPNGICINDDGTFFITDQEGHWIPKNRINLVEPGKFYGNFWGYHDRTNSDSEMEQPVVWITNEFDRSPAELLWTTSDRWGPLSGQLLAVSYGMGQVFVVPHETVDGQIQGGQTPLPLPIFPTGVMRGKFSPSDGQLYVAGMFAWAGNRVEPGGFYRVRYTGEEVVVATGIKARQGALDLTFSAPLDEAFVRDTSNYTIQAWDLRRSANYGSDHYNERSFAIASATLLPDARTIRLTIPDLAPTWGMKCEYTVRSAAGTEISSEIHNTIHALSKSP